MDLDDTPLMREPIDVAALFSNAERKPAPPIAPGAQFILGSYTNKAGTRAYKLYVPSGYAGQALPLVVMLHGCGQNPDDFAVGTRMNELAERPPRLVLYPVQAPSANNQQCWNWFNAGDQLRDRGEPSLIAGMTRQVMATYKVDERRVYVAGLSAGGAMAAVMGVTYPDLYAAAGVHAGLAYGAARDLASALAAMQGKRAAPRAATPNASAVPTIVFHGDRDTVVHPRNADQVILQGAARYHAVAGAQPRVLRQSGRVPDGYAYTQYIHLDPQGRPFQEQWLVHGAGHAWSGGSIRGSYTDPKGPDSSKEMLRFFDANPRLEKKSG